MVWGLKFRSGVCESVGAVVPGLGSEHETEDLNRQSRSAAAKAASSPVKTQQCGRFRV